MYGSGSRYWDLGSLISRVDRDVAVNANDDVT
jgi:hypothetical protein